MFYPCSIDNVDVRGESWDCGNAEVSEQCTNNTHGVICSQCMVGYWRVDHQCAACPDGDFDLFGLVVMCILILVTLYTAFFFSRHDRLHHSIQEDFALLLRQAQEADMKADGIIIETSQNETPQKGTGKSVGSKKKGRKGHKLGLASVLKASASRPGPRFHTEMMGTLKILLSWAQCLSLFGTSLSIVPWPESFSLQLQWLNTVFNLDLISMLMPEECYMDTSFFASLRTQSLVLPVFITVLVVAYQLLTQLMLRLCESKRMFGFPPYPQDMQLRIARIRALRSIFFMVFLLYPGLCNKLFSVFKCTTYGSKAYLNVDLSVTCWEGDHMLHAYVTGGLILVYVLGIPFIIFMTLKSNLQKIKENPGDPILKTNYGCLYAQYDVSAPYFELYQMGRKFTLAVVVLMIDDAWLSLLVAFSVCFGYYVLVLKKKPFRHQEEAILEQITSLQLLSSLVVAFVLTGKEQTGQQTQSLLIEGFLVGTTVIVWICLAFAIALTLSSVGIKMSRLVVLCRTTIRRGAVQPAVAADSLSPTKKDPGLGGTAMPPVIQRRKSVETIVELTASQNESLKDQNNALTTALVHIQKQYKAAAQELTALQQDRGAVSEAFVQALHVANTRCDHICHKRDLSHQRTIRNCGVCKRPVSVRPGRPMDCCTKCGFLCCVDCASGAAAEAKAAKPNRWRAEDI